MSTPAKKQEKAVAKEVQRDVKEVVREAVRSATPKAKAHEVLLARNQNRRLLAAAMYLTSMCHPSSQPPRRAPSLMDSFPTCVWKTVRNTVIKTVALPGSGTGAPNYGVASRISPGLVENMEVATVMLGGLWTSTVKTSDPTYSVANGPVNDNTMYAFRTTAMSVRVQPTSAVLAREGICRIKLISGGPAGSSTVPDIAGETWGILDNSTAPALDAASERLEHQEWCWTWANVDDLTFFTPSTQHHGPAFILEISGNAAVNSFNVTVTRHYEGHASLAAEMVFPSESLDAFDNDDFETARDLSDQLVPAPTVAEEIKEQDAEIEGDGWSDHLRRGAGFLLRSLGSVAARGPGVLGKMAAAVLSEEGEEVDPRELMRAAAARLAPAAAPAPDVPTPTSAPFTFVDRLPRR